MVWQGPKAHGTMVDFYGLFFKIAKEEGILGLWRGVGATCGRATALSAVELASYDDIKMRLLHSEYFREGLSLHLSSALCAGFLASLASSPFDVVKSRIMHNLVVQMEKACIIKECWIVFT